MIEIVGAVLLARRFSPSLNLAASRERSGSCMATAMLAPIPAALLRLDRHDLGMAMRPFLISFQTWWFGHALGLATITPLRSWPSTGHR